MRNPKWHRDEIILALDLYFDPNRGSVDSRNPKVIALSELLNKLPIFPDKPDEEKFRNPNGVSLKLSNFLAIDPNYEGKGMSSYSLLDEQVFNEFSTNKERLAEVAYTIKHTISNEQLVEELIKIEEDENTEEDSIKEGSVLYKLHKYRERNKKITRKKKEHVWKTTGKLCCEVCGFDFHQAYGEIGKGFIECHHTKPLASYDENSKTKLDDLALVCANCHRMLHRKLGILGLADLKLKIASIR